MLEKQKQTSYEATCGLFLWLSWAYEAISHAHNNSIWSVKWMKSFLLPITCAVSQACITLLIPTSFCVISLLLPCVWLELMCFACVSPSVSPYVGCQVAQCVVIPPFTLMSSLVSSQCSWTHVLTAPPGSPLRNLHPLRRFDEPLFDKLFELWSRRTSLLLSPDTILDMNKKIIWLSPTVRNDIKSHTWLWVINIWGVWVVLMSSYVSAGCLTGTFDMVNHVEWINYIKVNWNKFTQSITFYCTWDSFFQLTS